MFKKLLLLEERREDKRGGERRGERRGEDMKREMGKRKEALRVRGGSGLLMGKRRGEKRRDEERRGEDRRGKEAGEDSKEKQKRRREWSRERGGGRGQAMIVVVGLEKLRGAVQEGTNKSFAIQT
eukprot:TRINITY_DN191_c1_g1_i5.p3 TRINITY_DN191_c1_g1~~TRINITY_DN191_c1_g1_i5.p3  ORF type:complete len:125 (+),score=46.03 TRINITY_DN191_c1_g1_i5:450-824(+)